MRGTHRCLARLASLFPHVYLSPIGHGLSLSITQYLNTEVLHRLHSRLSGSNHLASILLPNLHHRKRHRCACEVTCLVLVDMGYLSRFLPIPIARSLHHQQQSASQ